MTLDPGLEQRLIFLLRIVSKEIQHLEYSDQKVFTTPFSVQQVELMDADPEFAEAVEAFVGRFGRLQDTVGDKLVPAWLKASQEKVSVAIDNLDKAEKAGMLASVDQWIELRRQRNAMVHEYMEDPDELSEVLNRAHIGVGLLIDTAKRLIADIENKILDK